MPVPFAESVARLEALLARRTAIAERIDSRLLNVKGKDASRRRDRVYVDAVLESCVHDPIFQPGQAQRSDASALIVRAYEHWDRHRWPGANGRAAYAQTLAAVILLHLIEDLTLRIWENDEDGAPQRLERLQRVLDAMNGATPSATMVRDARWLLYTAQGPLTRDLAPYFRIANRVARTFHGEAGLELHAAGAKLAGGHLRSQLRQRASELERSPDDPAVLVMTRNSNAIDVALLVWDLVPLLDAYTTACRADDRARRRSLADTILQGCSADPELLLTRLDLLAPCTMIETLLVQMDDTGRVAFTETGRQHLEMLARYAELIDEASTALADDAPALDAAPEDYSPFALTYGFCADLLSLMALDTLHGRPPGGVTLEDLFVPGGSRDARMRVDGWQIDYSPAWGEDMLARVVHALDLRRSHTGRANASDVRDASLQILSGDAPDSASAANAQEYCITSDLQRALATGATAFPRGQFLADRNEGRFLASAETDGRWFGISKAVLTERIAQGQDVVMTGVPPVITQILELTCPNLVR